jgi:acylphosphatase
MALWFGLLFVLTLLATIVPVSNRQDFSMTRFPPFLAFALLVAPPAFADQKQAISATVTGDDQQVGFRAMVMKQAIEHNLAGIAKNEPNQVVQFTLQGDADRLSSAIATIREGTKKSSNIQVSTTPAGVDPALNTFTVIDWTSTSRGIKTPYTLVFNLRPDDKEISKSEPKRFGIKFCRQQSKAMICRNWAMSTERLTFREWADGSPHVLYRSSRGRAFREAAR